MIRIDVSVLGEEAILRLDTLPRRLRSQLAQKLGVMMTEAKAELLSEKFGKYLDPTYIQATTEQTGSLLVGSIEGEDKPGVYSILPTKAQALRFVSKDGDVVFARQVAHPYMKSGPVIERYFREKKPWLIEQVEDFVFDAVYNDGR